MLKYITRNDLEPDAIFIGIEDTDDALHLETCFINKLFTIKSVMYVDEIELKMIGYGPYELWTLDELNGLEPWGGYSTNRVRLIRYDNLSEKDKMVLKIKGVL